MSPDQTDTLVSRRQLLNQTLTLGAGAAIAAAFRKEASAHEGHDHDHHHGPAQKLEMGPAQINQAIGLEYSPKLSFELRGEPFRVPASVPAGAKLGMHGQAARDSKTNDVFYSIKGQIMKMTAEGKQTPLLPKEAYGESNIHGMAVSGDMLYTACNGGKVERYQIIRDEKTNEAIRLEKKETLPQPKTQDDLKKLAGKYAPTDVQYSPDANAQVGKLSSTMGYGDGRLYHYDPESERYVGVVGAEKVLFSTPHGNFRSRDGLREIVANREGHKLSVLTLTPDGKQLTHLQQIDFDKMEGLKGFRPCDFCPHPTLNIAVVPMLAKKETKEGDTVVEAGGRGDVLFVQYDQGSGLIGKPLGRLGYNDFNSDIEFDTKHVHHADWWVRSDGSVDLVVHAWNPGGLAVFKVGGLTQKAEVEAEIDK